MKPPKGWYSRDYLPHFDSGSLPQFVTFRLADPLPKDLLERQPPQMKGTTTAKTDRERRKRFEAHLDLGLGSAWLKDPKIAALVESALLHFNNARYWLHAWVIMPNHVHALFTPEAGVRIFDILHSWKSFSSKQANRVLRRSGRFWQEEYFDRYIRNERHYWAAVEYIEMNPVKAGLCQSPEEWTCGSAGRRTIEGHRTLES